ncbi:Lysyl-tRNA synthetase 1 isoform 1 [Hibiscus syriacus]|uniref:Lysyl-tRNA synthetase 1 isoform 1 n=1 Tax=Hibiscus syriacus TaxID=106335 RepID=A0A6A2ZM67_HIBSY|nr:Lysyl-tRNA synthetase 1 isoform 1 [Hibiscus syriacus]
MLPKTPLPTIGEAFAEVRKEENCRRVMMGDNKDPPITTTRHRPFETLALVYRGPQFQKRSDAENTLDVRLTKSQLKALHKILETSTADGSLAIQVTHLRGKILNEDENLNTLLITPLPDPNLPQKFHTNDILIIPKQPLTTAPSQHHNDDPNVKNAFLNGELAEEVYMDFPPGFKKEKGQAMTSRAYTQGHGDHTMFYKHSKEEFISIEFELKDLGKLKYFLEMEVARSRTCISISQWKYVLDLLKDTGILGYRPVETPMEFNLKLGTDELGEEVNRGRYQRLVGKLIYLFHTRTDIAFNVSFINQYMHNPREKHLEVVNRVLRYLKGTPGKGLHFKKTNSRYVDIYTDADWACSVNDRRSTNGYCSYVWEGWQHFWFNCDSSPNTGSSSIVEMDVGVENKAGYISCDQVEPSRRYQETNKPIDKTQRSLAQNREAARKSRIRKKAYVQELESSRLKLAQLEQELERARQQVQGGLSGTTNPGQSIRICSYDFHGDLIFLTCAYISLATCEVVMPHIEPLTDQQQLEVCQLRHSSQQAEDALSQGIDKLQHKLVQNVASDSSWGNYRAQMAVATDVLEAVEGFVNQNS